MGWTTASQVPGSAHATAAPSRARPRHRIPLPGLDQLGAQLRYHPDVISGVTSHRAHQTRSVPAVSERAARSVDGTRVVTKWT